LRFEPNVFPYLSGAQFSNGLCVRIATNEKSIPNRLALLDVLLADKRVVHVGCCDHVPLIRQKVASNTWLHARICRVASHCFGVDTSADGIDLMQNELGYNEVVCADIVADDIPVIGKEQWDYMLLGELVEHLDDPVGFLTAIRERYRASVRRLIITVPNALSLLNARFALNDKECINTDHRHWFSPYTLARMLVSAGMEPEDFMFCEPFPTSVRRPSLFRPRATVIDFLLRRHPAFREGLLMIAKL